MLAQLGAGAIWVADWNTDNLAKLKEDMSNLGISTEIYTHRVDVSDSKQVSDWVDAIITRSGALHGAANVAGVSQPAFSGTHPAILTQTDDDWRRVFGVNIDGIMHCTRAQVRAMVDMPKGTRPAIVNVSSMASLLRGPSAFAYGASKAACTHFTSCVAKDVYQSGIRVNTVSPGE
jgi:chanoclavine-I dehydrogenase